VTDTALAVSHTEASQRPTEHQGYYVRRGRHPARAANASRSDSSPRDFFLVNNYAAVVAKEAVVADALAKCVLLCPPATAQRTLHEFGASRVGEY
jgi:hypothetical protein